jgi:hypothetical protein
MSWSLLGWLKGLGRSNDGYNISQAPANFKLPAVPPKGPPPIQGRFVVTETKWRTHTVYKGELNGQIVYIGTTIQEPKARFRWHKANGKNFIFTVLARYETAEEMLAEERRLIELHKPKHNKRLKQNLNVKLTQVQLDSRVNDPRWCQKCLKRRVNPGYKRCMYCPA